MFLSRYLVLATKWTLYPAWYVFFFVHVLRTFAFPQRVPSFFLVYLLVRFRVCININTGMQDKSYFESSLTENLLKKGARVDFYLTINRLIKLVWSNLSRVIFLLSSHGKRWTRSISWTSCRFSFLPAYNETFRSISYLNDVVETRLALLIGKRK